MLLEVLEDRRLFYSTVGQDNAWSFTTLGYSYSNLLDGGLAGISASDLVAASQEAMGVWSAVAPLRFEGAPDSGPLPTEDDNNYDAIGHPIVRWGHHDIDFPTTLAHGFHPGNGGIAGDMHFDDGARTWSVDGKAAMSVSFLEVAVHELGHALGMEHANGDTTKEGDTSICPPAFPAVMHACLRGGGTWSYGGLETAYLLQDDIDGIRSLYGTGLGYVLNLDGQLHVYGTYRNDVLTVRTDGGTISVSSSESGSFTRSLDGIRSIHLHGQYGDDIFRVEGNGGLPTFLHGGEGNNTFDISYGHRNLGTTLGLISIVGGSGDDRIFVYDNGSPSAATYHVQDFRIDRTGIGGIIYANVERVTLWTGSGSDTVNVSSTAAGTALFLNSGGGSDVVNVGDSRGVQGMLGQVWVANDAGLSTLKINDGGDAARRVVSIQSTGTHGYAVGLAPANIFWDSTDMALVKITTGTNADTVQVVANVAPLELGSAGGIDAVTVGRDGSLSGIVAPLTITDSVQSSLVIDGRNDARQSARLRTEMRPDGPYGVVEGMTANGWPGAPIRYKYADLWSVTLHTSAAGAKVVAMENGAEARVVGHGAGTQVVVQPTQGRDAFTARSIFGDTLTIAGFSGGTPFRQLTAQNVAEILIDAAADDAVQADDVVKIESTPEGTALTVVTGTGIDTVVAGDGSLNLDSLRGPVLVQDAELTIYDQNNPHAPTLDPQTQALRPTTYRLSDHELVRVAPDGRQTVPIRYWNLSQLRLFTGNDGNRISVTAAPTHTEIVGGLAGDVLTLDDRGTGNVEDDTAQIVNVPSITISDQAISRFNREYSLYYDEGDTYPRRPPRWVATQSESRYEVRYRNIREIFVYGGTAGTAFNVPSTPAEVPLTIIAGTPINSVMGWRLPSGGFSTVGRNYNAFSVGAGGSVQRIRSVVTLRGGGSDNRLALHNANATTRDLVSVTPATVGAQPGDQFFGPGGSLAYSGISTLTLDLSQAADNAVRLTPSATTTFTIHGHADPFQAGHGATLSLDLTGVTGAVNVASATPGSGQWTFDQRQPVHYTYIASQVAIDEATPQMHVASRRLQIRGGPDDDIVSVSEDPAASGFLQVRVTLGANPPLVRSFAMADFDAIDIDALGGQDQLYVLAAPVTTTIRGGDGHDIIKLGGFAGGTLDGIRANVVVQSSDALDMLVLYDDTNIRSTTYTLTPGRVRWGAAGSVQFGTSPDDMLRYLFVNGGRGGNTFQVDDPGPIGYYTYLTTGDGDDLINILATQTGVYVNGAWGHDIVRLGSSARGPGDLLAHQGTLAAIEGWVSVGSNYGSIDLVLDDSGDTTRRSASIGDNTQLIYGTAHSIAGLAPTVISYLPYGSFNTGGVSSLTVFGGRGDDTFQVRDVAPATATTIDGGGGRDTLDYSAYHAGVTVNLATRLATGLASVTNVENVDGSPFDDSLTGDAQTNLLRGNGGRDTLSGLDGNDILVGGEGNDTLIGGNGRDILIGGLGADVLDGGAGDDILIGGRTTHEANDAALLALLAEWSRSDLSGTALQQYRTRIGNLRNGGASSLAGGYRLYSATVFDDATTDTLTGGADLDWFWTALSGTKDKTDRRTSTEIAN
jgi:Ca2+-binding RTX toxin-like protein